jgi:hypothetical protein
MSRDSFGVARPINPSLVTEPHRIVASAPGKKTWKFAFQFSGRELHRVEVPELRPDDRNASADRDRAFEAKGRKTTGGPFLLSSSNTLILTSVGANRGVLFVPAIRVAYDVSENFNVYAREAFAYNDPVPTDGSRGTAWSNPIVGALYRFKLGDAFSITPGVELDPPLGTGGGNSPDPGAKTAADFGTLESPSFSINYFTSIPNVTFGFSKNRTFAELRTAAVIGARTRGEMIDRDPTTVSLRNIGILGYSLFSDILDIDVALVNFTRLTDSVDPSSREFWYVEAGLAFTVGSFVFSTDLGRALAGPVADEHTQFADMVVDVSF